MIWKRQELCHSTAKINGAGRTGRLQEFSTLQKHSQRVVTSEEAETLINQGYGFVGVLPNGKVIVQK
ncbi:MAG: hypothetical protein ACREBB_08585 [Nitrosotalea sp.]